MKLAIAFLLFYLSAVLSVAVAKTPGEVEIGSVLREANMQGLLVPNMKLSAFRGKPLLINVWASWCGPCRQEMASVERLAQRYGGKQFNVIGISTDDYIDRATLFLKQNQVTFPNFIDSQLFLENTSAASNLDQARQYRQKIHASRFSTYCDRLMEQDSRRFRKILAQLRMKSRAGTLRSRIQVYELRSKHRDYI